jgi:hypothetical protein
MNNTIELKDCKAGDKFAHHTNVFEIVPILEREFSGNDLLHPAWANHSSLYTGVGTVIQMTGDGAVETGVEKACEGDTVHVFRWHDSDAPDTYIGDGIWNNGLGSPKYPAQLVVDKALEYVKEGDKYYFADLPMLAILCELRGNYAEEILVQQGLSIIDSMFENNRTLKICSQLVFDCFVETGHDIKIVGLDAELVYPPLSHIPRGQFVTPHALYMSPNFTMIGELKL